MPALLSFNNSSLLTPHSPLSEFRSPVHNRLNYMNIMNLISPRLKRIPVEDDEVGVFPRLERTEAVFHAHQVGVVDRVRLDDLVQRQSLRRLVDVPIRVPGGLSRQRDLEVQHRVQGGQVGRVVRAQGQAAAGFADGVHRIRQPLRNVVRPFLRRLVLLGAEPLRRAVGGDVVFGEFRDVVREDVPRVRTADAEVVVPRRAKAARRFQQRVDGQRPDGVNVEVEAGFGGLLSPMKQLVGVHHRQHLRHPRIRVREGGGAVLGGAVIDDLIEPAADAVAVVFLPQADGFVEGGLGIRLVRELPAAAQADGAGGVVEHGAEVLVHQPLGELEVAAVNQGRDPVRRAEVGEPIRGLRENAHVNVFRRAQDVVRRGGFFKVTRRVPLGVADVDLARGRIGVGGVLIDGRGLEGFGVAPAAMAARGEDRHRLVRADGVEVRLDGAVGSEVGVIPAPAHVGVEVGVGGNEFRDPLLHGDEVVGGGNADEAVEADGHEGMNVAVDDAGHDEPPAEVFNRIAVPGVGEGGGIIADERDAVPVDDDGFGPRLSFVDGVDASVSQDSFGHRGGSPLMCACIE